MLLIKRFLKEKDIHRLFEVILTLKGIHALIEIVGGFFLYFASQEFIYKMVFFITQDELLENPQDFLSNYLIKSAGSLSIDSSHFAVFYLLSHGIIKIVLVTELLRKRLWAYPASIVVFGLFIIYQMYRFTFTHSLWLILFTLLDVLVIWLTVHEYRYMKRHFSSQH